MTRIKDSTVFKFFALVSVISIPFWIIGSLTHIQLLPGLPLDALTAVCPGVAAIILSYREGGKPNTLKLLKRAFDYKRIGNEIWYVPILLLMPIASVALFIILRINGVMLPNPRIEIMQTLVLCIIFFISAIGEELGWSGYAIDPMQKRVGALNASIMLGAVWAIFHYIALFHIDRSAAWVAGWTIGTVALRVISTWLYNNNGKSIFAVVLFHMSINVSWQLFPVNGTYYDPIAMGFILTFAAVVIVSIFNPRTLMLQNK